MKRELGIEPQLIPGTAGVFDVVVDGRKVFSKHDKGRFPDPGEITGPLKKAARPK